MEYIGIDLGQKYSDVHVLDESGKMVFQGKVATTERSLKFFFGKRERAKVCMEACGVSPWVGRVLGSCGHEVVLSNPRRLRLIAQSKLKTDRLDAELLARLLRADPSLLCPVHQRSAETQWLRAQMGVRRCLVLSRVRAINSVRGILRSFGYRMARCRTDRFEEKFSGMEFPEHLAKLLEPLVVSVRELSDKIAQLDEELVVASKKFEVVERLQQIKGVGPKVALAFVLSIEEPSRFRRSRDVGGFFGLRPSVRQSGGPARLGRITKQGDGHVRALLVQAAHTLMRSRQDSALRRWALGLAGRVGKRKAAVAVARKLGVLMHHLWVSGQDYQPFPQPGPGGEKEAKTRGRARGREKDSVGKATAQANELRNWPASASAPPRSRPSPGCGHAPGKAHASDSPISSSTSLRL